MMGAHGQGARRGNAARTAWAALIGVAVLGAAASASALIITGGPTYSLPGGGSCTVTNIATTGTGATITCSGVNLGAHSNVYFGVRVDQTVNGNTMTGAQPASGNRFRFSTANANTITYTGTTSVTSLSGLGSPTVTNTLNITRTSGSATIVATGGSPADNGTRGDIQRLFRLNSGSTFTFDVDILASASGIGSGQACPAVYNPAHASAGAGGDISRVDFGFYFSDCGDGMLDSPEQCDDGAANGTAASCCTTSCTYKSNGTACTDDGNPCTLDQCNGVSEVCQHPPGNAGALCRATAGVCDVAETCTGSSATCPSDAKSTALCRASVGVCDAAEFCNGSSNDCPADAKSTSVCRAASGGCDVAESCDGAGNDCPADDVAPLNTVCRAVAGVCDVAEVCDGVSKACPTDDFQPSSLVCRGVADVCDVAESCTGTSADCPADSFEPSTTVCRSAVDVCDAAEHCTGSSSACPADGKSTAECRAAAGVCDLAETCDGVSDDCPADAKSTAVCRAAGDVCDVDDVCDGVNDDCPADGKQPDGTDCSDGQFCNGEEVCQAGTCADQTDPCPFTDTCDESQDMCLASACPSSPQGGCRTAQKNLLVIKNKDFDSGDKLIWKFIKGAQTTQIDFANPTSTATYALCLYAGSTQALVAELNVPPSSTRWKTLGSVGFKYLDQTLSADGTQKIVLKGGVNGKSKALVKGKGANLPDPLAGGALELPVTAQLLNYESGICWEGTFTSAKKNEQKLFKAKQP